MSVMTNQKVAYIAGLYRPRGFWRHIPVWKWVIIAWNVHQARKVALKWWKRNYAVICPHSNTAFFDGACDDSVWLLGDLAIMKRCDVVVMMKGWEKSSGACEEHLRATVWGLHIVYE